MADTVIARRYRLLEELGRGAMSSVWLADDEELGRKVAVKTLIPSADGARFEREARAAAALSHPNICGLYDYGAVDGKPFMVLEYLPNGSLEERLGGQTPLADDETLRISTEIAAGLAHAHGRDLIHRDLKPANVLFDVEGRAKIADFGIARMRGQGTLTEAGTVLGTASYISPEQAAGLPAGPASDVYSFGVILFRMLTGRLPFSSTNAMELVRMHRDDPPPAVSDFRADAPARLAALADAALAKDPAARPADGAALFHELRAAGEGAATIIATAAADPAGATQVIRPRPGAQRSIGRRRNWLPLAALVLLLLGGVALALVTNRGGNASPVQTTVRGLSLPAVSTAGSTSSTAPTANAETTTSSATSTTPATTTPATTRATPPTTTAPATTPTTTAPVTTAPVTTVVPSTTASVPTTTTVPTTTAGVTSTDTTPPTTTAP